MIKLEIERKWLIEAPISWTTIASIFENLADIWRISQTYLTPEKGEPAARIRQTVKGLTGDTDTVYHFNQKKPTGNAGVHEETEHRITDKQYQKFLKDANPEKCAVEKTRFVFKWHDQVFELDLFKGHLKGLAILEIELNDINDSVELPPFLKVIKEVTKDRRFTNFSLADKKLKDAR